MADRDGFWTKGMLGEVKGSRHFVPNLEKYAGLSRAEFVELAQKGAIQPAPEGRSGRGPYPVASEGTGVGIGLNEGYSMADIAHWYLSMSDPSREHSSSTRPTATTTRLKEGKVPDWAIVEAHDKFTSHVRQELPNFEASRKAAREGKSANAPQPAATEASRRGQSAGISGRWVSGDRKARRARGT